MLMMSLLILTMLFGIPGLFLAFFGLGLLIRFLPEILLIMIVLGLVRGICWRRGFRGFRVYRRYYW